MLEVRSTSPTPIEWESCDVLIVGAGPVGCAVARKLLETNNKLKVTIVDAGSQQSAKPGEHLKNAFVFQRNIDQFVNVIKGHLNPLSIPVDQRPTLTMDPGAFRPDRAFIRNGQNPDQKAEFNLPAAAATFGIGGMATHWTCATPRQHPQLERWAGIPGSSWDELYTEAEEWFNVHPRKGVPLTSHPFVHSIRHQIVQGVLRNAFPELTAPDWPQPLPLACQRRADNPEFVTWSGADTVLGPLITDPDPKRFETFRILEQHRCNYLLKNNSSTSIEGVVVDDLVHWKSRLIQAKKAYVICAGAVLTPQILFNSEITPEPLGCYLSEQPMAFCQVVLKQNLLDKLDTSPYLDRSARDRVGKYRQDQIDNPATQHQVLDPIPFPMTEPEPQVYIPVSPKHPWHAQIHRDAFQYGEIGPNVDGRVIVDLRWFGMMEQVKANAVTFSRKYKDQYGMPQPTFHYDSNSKDERYQLHDMMGTMVRAANALGGFLSPSEPRFMTPGLTLHIHGTVRLGDRPEDSVADHSGKVWGFDNLYVGGNGVLPRSNACNPTLTSVALAIHAAKEMLKAM